MRDHSPTAKILLARLGFTDSAELWALTQGTDTSGAAIATTRLALNAALAIENVDNADRLGKQKLAGLADAQATEADNVARGFAGNAMWLVQAAEQYREQLARLNAAVDAFHAASTPLAALADLHALPAADAAATA